MDVGGKSEFQPSGQTLRNLVEKANRWQEPSKLTSREVPCITVQFGRLWPPAWPGQFIENRRLALATGRNSTRRCGLLSCSPSTTGDAAG